MRISLDKLDEQETRGIQTYQQDSAITNMFRRDGMTFLVASGAAVLLILLPLACARLSSPPPSKTGTPSTSDHDPHFDFYVFSMSFQPEFCYEHKRDNFDGCRHPNDEWRGALTIHGLWPERNDGSWPSTCTSEAFDPSVIDELGRERFEQHWPNVKSPPSSPEHDDFWVHEWTKHGTCSGLSQKDYFESALESYVPTPALVKMAEGAKVPKTELVSAYGGSDMVALVCDARRYLSEVRVCIGKDEDGKATGRIPCNEGVLRETSCSEDEVFISTFPHAGVE